MKSSKIKRSFQISQWKNVEHIFSWVLSCNPSTRIKKICWPVMIVKLRKETRVIRILITIQLTVKTLQPLNIKPWRRSLGPWWRKKITEIQNYSKTRKLHIFLKKCPNSWYYNFEKHSITSGNHTVTYYQTLEEVLLKKWQKNSKKNWKF